MSKKLMLLALAAVSAAMFAMPAFASAADEPLHLSSTPAGLQPIDDVGANPTLSTTGGSTIECETFGGNATFESGGTTGSLDLTFSGNCHDVSSTFKCNSTGAASGTIVTTTLPFHLLTLANNKPGVLVTPSTAVPPAFAHIECAGGLVKFTVTGNGVIGTITEPACGANSTSATIDFNATAHGVQEHTTVAGTTTEYRLMKGTENAAQDATGKITFTAGSNPKLECT